MEENIEAGTSLSRCWAIAACSTNVDDARSVQDQHQQQHSVIVQQQQQQQQQQLLLLKMITIGVK